ncbi:MAG: YicC family protein [Spirochaetales bacterium]|nr:YicC family protein [Spirochaetales bacterium]
MKSMTAYGYSSYSSDEFFLEVEIKSYNNRYLDIYHNINSNLASFEEEIDQRIKEVAERGKVEISVKLKTLKNDGQLVVDKDLLQKYEDAFSSISNISGKSVSLSASDYLSIEGLMTYVQEKNPEIYREALFTTLDKALEQFNSAKLREGEATKADLYKLGKQIEDSNDKIKELFDGYEDYYAKLLLSKYEELKISEKLDENQFRQEVGSILVKYSINEEQIRLKTHLKEYFRLLDCNESVGKRLDFLMQEMNRETNTTASKSQIAQINIEAVKMKDAIENIREQIRNVE